MTLFKSTLTLLLLLLLTACMGGGPTVKPQWVVKGLCEQTGTKACAIGSAPFSHHGLQHQKQVAMANAIDIIARQKGVTVQNSLERLKRVDEGQVTQSSSIGYSLQTVEGTTVNAKIKDVYHDKYYDIYYVLMVEN